MVPIQMELSVTEVLALNAIHIAAVAMVVAAEVGMVAVEVVTTSVVEEGPAI